MVSPWALGVALRREAIWACLIGGAIQVIASISAAQRRRVHWRAWEYWILLATGFWFIIQPFLGHYEEGQYWATITPALLTIVFCLWTLMKPRVNGWTGPSPKARA